MKKELSKVSISPNCTGIQCKHDISKCRGMSDPFFFSFNLEPKSHVMVSHGIVFVSTVLHPDTRIKLLTEDRDIRVEHLLKYVWDNFLKEQRTKLIAAIGDLEKMIDEDKTSIETLTQKIKTLEESQHE